jgi:phospho-N-acetylmuramoyl-pentapeptide-transferase
MGGTVIVGATVGGYLIAHLFLIDQPGRGVTASGLLVLFLMVGLGTVGFLDDYLKIRFRRSLGLNKTAKLVGQLVIGVAFAVLALNFPDPAGITPASEFVSYVRDIGPLFLGSIGFVVLAYLFIAGFSNAVNLTDGLDGLAAGCSAMVCGAYTIISFWQFTHDCTSQLIDGCYTVRDPLDVTLVAAAGLGACLGFLWWNTSPARIFMGDTGSLALGGLLAGLAVVTRTELLLVVLGGLFVAVTLSVVIQVAFFRATRRRVFRMAPLHHHFELAGWTENTVIVRFWLVTGMSVAFGLGLFYADWLAIAGL